ncbi:MAG: UDP-N-acetylmuramoyl-L-alanyl-D-glutamate--2,6-diaminopimelate ligase [Patescibacteria group bacterium]
MFQEIKNIYHLAMAIGANLWYGFPSRNLTVIGVTGTDGKTTTASLIYNILKSSDTKVSMISSVGAVINGKDYSLPFHVTTPSPFALQKFIKMAVERGGTNGKKFLVLEVTSHSLDQFRIYGINFEVGVITNVSHEHLDYHKNYRKYAKTKLKLFQKSKDAVVNKDDRSYKILMPELRKLMGRRPARVVTYGLTKTADVNPENFEFKSNMLGEFNTYNTLAAITSARLLGIKSAQIRKAILDFKSPLGRQDMVYDEDFAVMIDFAHTPNSIKEILKVLREKVSGRIIHVFGSAGQRDRTKRPEMGKYSSEYCDIMIVTAEDPRSEDVDKISRDILTGVKDSELKMEKGSILKIPDRQKAIITAIDIAGENDLVLITGKAHEKSMNYGKGEVPWDEYEAVKKALDRRYEKN